MQWDDIMKLACLMLGKDYDSIIDNYGDSVIEDMFYDEYNITLGDFEHLLEDLIKFTHPWIAPITGELYQGFVVRHDESLMRVIIKEKYG